MPSSAALQISKPRGSRRSSEIAREWLVRFAEVCQREITPVLAAIWSEELGDIAPERLENACRKLMRTWTTNFLPTPGAVRAQLDAADQKGFELETEQAWRKAYVFCGRYYHPDIGISRNAPALPAEIEYAIRAIPGGLHYISNCRESELVWAKKSFVEAFNRAHESKRCEHLIGRTEARKILADIVKGPNRNQLVAAPANSETTPDPPSRDEVREVLKSVTKLTPEEQKEKCIRVQTQVLQMKRESEADALEFMRKYGLAADTKPSSAIIDVYPENSKSASPGPETNVCATTEQTTD